LTEGIVEVNIFSVDGNFCKVIFFLVKCCWWFQGNVAAIQITLVHKGFVLPGKLDFIFRFSRFYCFIWFYFMVHWVFFWRSSTYQAKLWYSRTKTRTGADSNLGGARDPASFSVYEDCDFDAGIC